jgi:hypothetical protein
VTFLKLSVGGATALAVLILGGPLSCAKQAEHDHSAHDHANHSAHDHADHSAASDNSAVPAAQNYADAIRQIQGHMTSLDAIIKSGKYDAVHNDCVAIGKLCDAIDGAGGLAAAQDSPVPKDKVNGVAEAANQISAASRSLHKAAHADDLPQVKADYARMSNLVESLTRYTRGR